MGVVRNHFKKKTCVCELVGKIEAWFVCVLRGPKSLDMPRSSRMFCAFPLHEAVSRQHKHHKYVASDVGNATQPKV